MKTKNSLTVRPDSGSGLPELKRAESLLRLTESILGKPIVPTRNRRDEQGRKQGLWTEHGIFDEDMFEGAYVDGKQHGRWVLRFADGWVEEGEYVNGKRHGYWVWRLTNVDREQSYVVTKKEGHFVDGEEHGEWLMQDSDGYVWKRAYENGIRVW